MSDKQQTDGRTPEFLTSCRVLLNQAAAGDLRTLAASGTKRNDTMATRAVTSQLINLWCRDSQLTAGGALARADN